MGGTNIDVRWVGNDRGGVGIKSYDVEVSLNGGAYQPWLTNTLQTQATYPGYFGQQLQFRVKTSDFLGQQAQPATATTVIIDDDYLHWRAAIFGNAVGDPALSLALVKFKARLADESRAKNRSLEATAGTPGRP